MIYDADEISGQVNDYDVCIVGSGPSGLTVALELLYSGLSICVVEGGALQDDEFYDQLKTVQSPKAEISACSRVRAFGGTSIEWSGYIATLDAIDFVDRGQIHQGWPISADELYRLLNLRGYRYGMPHLSLFDVEDSPITRTNSVLTPKTFLVQSPPMNFGRKFKYAFERKSFDLFSGAVVTSLDSRTTSGQISIPSLVFRTRTGRIGQITAKIYVLAAGCIENVRILLNSPDEMGVAIGNLHDQLGRGFMNHPKAYVGEVCLSQPVSVGHPLFRFSRGEYGGYTGLRVRESLQLSEGLLNHYLRLEPYEVPNIVRRSLAGVRKRLRSLFPKSMPALAWPARFSGSNLVGTDKSLCTTTRARVRCFLELEPSPENRISLSKTQDCHGCLFPLVEYDISARALSSLAFLLENFSREIRDAKLGVFVPSEIQVTEALRVDASHHLGGTKMGRDPRNSVTNCNLKVHGVENLYVAGGSSFPTGGNANPTLTMIALSMRLAEHLRAQFAS